jgi:site-specific recombinase XerD
VGEVVRIPTEPVTLEAAVAAFLDRHDVARSTRRVYHTSLRALIGGLGPTTPLAELAAPTVAAWFRARHEHASPATWNRELATLRSAAAWWRRQGWLAGELTGGLARRRETIDRTRALTAGQVEALLSDRGLALRERTLWRLLYESAARVGEVLALGPRNVAADESLAGELLVA